jgi:ribonuclease HI
MGPSAGADVVLILPEGNKLRNAICLHFPASNNIAEYEGLINGLRIAIEIGATWLYAYVDCKLVVDQVMKESNCETSFPAGHQQSSRAFNLRQAGPTSEAVWPDTWGPGPVPLG